MSEFDQNGKEYIRLNKIWGDWVRERESANSWDGFLAGWQECLADLQIKSTDVRLNALKAENERLRELDSERLGHIENLELMVCRQRITIESLRALAEKRKDLLKTAVIAIEGLIELDGLFAIFGRETEGSWLYNAKQALEETGGE
jgi:hypothetical protein